MFIAFLYWVMQCFSGTLCNNITYVLEKVSEEEIIQVIREVGLEDLVESLQEGLDSQLGEHGDKLSRGQKQRASIAWALIRRLKLIIFDKATSALDSISEKQI